MKLPERERQSSDILELANPEMLNIMIGARFGKPAKKKGMTKAAKAKKEQKEAKAKLAAAKKIAAAKEKAKKAALKAKARAKAKADKEKAKAKIKAQKAKAKQAQKMKKTAKKPAAAKKPTAAKKPIAAKKTTKKTTKKPVAAAKKSAAPWQRPSTMAGLVKAANDAVTGMTRKQSAEAARLARDGAQTHKWQYKNDQGKWADYDNKASVEVEQVFATYQVNPYVDVRSVKSGDWHYMLDFSAMTQQNIQHHAHKIRPIQRVAVEE